MFHLFFFSLVPLFPTTKTSIPWAAAFCVCGCTVRGHGKGGEARRRKGKEGRCHKDQASLYMLLMDKSHVLKIG